MMIATPLLHKRNTPLKTYVEAVQSVMYGFVMYAPNEDDEGNVLGYRIFSIVPKGAFDITGNDEGPAMMYVDGMAIAPLPHAVPFPDNVAADIGELHIDGK